jgi:hypothetical protein
MPNPFNFQAYNSFATSHFTLKYRPVITLKHPLKQIIGLIMLLVGLAIAAIGLSIANPPMPTDGAQQKIGKNTEVETQQDQMNKAMNFKPPSNRSELIINSKR